MRKKPTTITANDITKCKGDGCPVKHHCHRYTAKPAEYQSYFLKVPYRDNQCLHYWGDNAEGIWRELKEAVK